MEIPATAPEAPLSLAFDLPPSLLARGHGAAAVLTLNRPAKRNALNDEAVLGIERFFTSLPGDVRSVVLAAEGEHFSAPGGFRIPCADRRRRFTDR